MAKEYTQRNNCQKHRSENAHDFELNGFCSGPKPIRMKFFCTSCKACIVINTNLYFRIINFEEIVKSEVMKATKLESILIDCSTFVINTVCIEFRRMPSIYIFTKSMVKPISIYVSTRVVSFLQLSQKKWLKPSGIEKN